MRNMSSQSVGNPISVFLSCYMINRPPFPLVILLMRAYVVWECRRAVLAIIVSTLGVSATQQGVLDEADWFRTTVRNCVLRLYGL